MILKEIKTCMCLLWLCLVHVQFNTAIILCEKYLCTPEAVRLRNYISIRTTRNDDFSPAVDYLRRLGAEQGVEVTVFEARPNYPVVIFKWPGRDPSLNSIVLLSNMDVNSACYEDGWDYPPFSGQVNDNCEIVGRGTQTQKSVTIQQYEALSRLKQNNVTLLRTVYMVVTSDQTTGSRNSMEPFVESKTFRNLNIGFTLGVGVANPLRNFLLFNQFKTKLVLRVDCYGQSTYSPNLPSYNSTAVGVCGYVLDSYNRYREQQYRLSLQTNDPGDYTVITFLGGQNLVEYEVVPAHIFVYYVANLALNTSVEEFLELVRGWVSPGRGNITVSTVYREEGTYYTKTDDSNPFYVALQEAFDELDIPFREITSATITDTAFVLKAGIPAFGLSPIVNTQILVNGVNERLSLRTYFEGIQIFEVVISRLANIPDEEVVDDPIIYVELPNSKKLNNCYLCLS